MAQERTINLRIDTEAAEVLRDTLAEVLWDRKPLLTDREKAKLGHVKILAAIALSLSGKGEEELR